MSAGHEPNHPYHLVEPSIWPFFGAVSAGVFMTGMVLFMHDVTAAMALIGFMMILATMYFWWSDVVKEATFQGHHTPIVQLGLRYGMALFIASEVMFFAAFFWAFFDASLFPTRSSSTCASSIPVASGRLRESRSLGPSTCPS